MRWPAGELALGRAVLVIRLPWGWVRAYIYACSSLAGSGALAQLGERRICNAEVTGSIPVRSIPHPTTLGTDPRPRPSGCGRVVVMVLDQAPERVLEPDALVSRVSPGFSLLGDLVALLLDFELP